MTDMSGVNIEISEITQVDTSDLNNQSLEDFTSVDVSLNTLEEIESDVEMKMVGMFPKKRSLKRNTGRRQLQKHKTMLNALKKYKKTKIKEENQPIDKLGRFRYKIVRARFRIVRACHTSIMEAARKQSGSVLETRQWTWQWTRQWARHGYAMGTRQ